MHDPFTHTTTRLVGIAIVVLTVAWGAVLGLLIVWLVSLVL